MTIIKKFRCSTCGEVFDDNASMEQHLEDNIEHVCDEVYANAAGSPIPKEVALKSPDGSVFKVNVNDNGVLGGNGGGLPVHYAQGINIQQGRVEFNNSRFKIIRYNLSFDQKPHVKISLEDTGEIMQGKMPQYRIYVYKTYFFIRFYGAFTGTLNWEATL